MTFKIGDEVRIRKDSDYYTGHINNPINCTGKIISFEQVKDHKYRVQWDNGGRNRYRDCDLELTNLEPEYKPFEELSDEDKAKIFLAWIKGENIETCGGEDPPEWTLCISPNWFNDAYYRIKPKPLTKPSINWDHVHPDYNWLAVDKDGLAAVFEKEPKTDCECWVEGGNWVDAKVFISFKPGTCDWRDSLVQRPE